MKINPKIRTHSIPFLLRKKEEIEVSNTRESYRVLLQEISGLEVDEGLHSLPDAKFKELDGILGGILSKNIDETILFPFMYANPILVGSVKRNIISAGIVGLYERNYETYKERIQEFCALKFVEKAPDTAPMPVLNKNGERMVVRFPPEPSGYLHIGHLKAALINEYYARTTGGELIIRFDDTNPAKESLEFEQAILDDLASLGIRGTRLTYTSNYFDILLGYCRQLLSLGLAYCDDTETEQMRSERGEGIESVYRNVPVRANLEIFDSIAEHPGFVVRAKIDMQSANKCLRDPVIYRRVEQQHHRALNTSRMYPTYDFACPIVDSIEGVTHALRTNEYRDRNEQYQWVLGTLGLRVPEIHDFSRLSFENTILSKRKLKEIVETRGIGWDDPRMPTIRGVLRQGSDPEVLKAYILSMGMGQKTCVVSWDKFHALNKLRYEKSAPRFMCVEKARALRTSLDGVPVYMDALDLDLLAEGEVATVLSQGNYAWNGGKFTRSGSTDYSGTKKAHFVYEENVVTVKTVEYGDLIRGDAFNEDSVWESEYLADKKILAVSPGCVVQFERTGFFRVDKDGRFILVPATRQRKRAAKQ